MGERNATGREPLPGELLDDNTTGPHALGREAERLVAEHLERLGLVVLCRNWRCPLGEIDIVATDGDVLAFCEVKARSGNDYGSPVHAVDAAKQHRLRALAKEWLDRYQLAGVRVRFDVASVLWPPEGTARLELVEGAF